MGKPWQFLSESSNESNRADPSSMLIATFEHRGKYIKEKLNGQKILRSYYEFILNVAVAQHDELVNGDGKEILTIDN